jgi:Flp pilus assembly protein TadG
VLTPSRRRDGERAQTLAMFALSMALFLFAMFAAAVDLTELYAAHVRFADAAEQAAMTGAGQVDYASAKAGFPQVAAGYQSVCTATGDAYTGVPGSTACHLTGDNVVVATVSAPVSVPIPMFGASFTIGSTYRAAPVLGGLQPVA